MAARANLAVIGAGILLTGTCGMSVATALALRRQHSQNSAFIREIGVLEARLTQSEAELREAQAALNSGPIAALESRVAAVEGAIQPVSALTAIKGDSGVFPVECAEWSGTRTHPTTG